MSAHNHITKVLFVCLGNICRSPLAEVVVKAAANKRGLGHYHFESAGTGDWHVGGSADHRSASKARDHGLDLSQHHAQQITASGILAWHWFVAMDQANYQSLLSMGVDASRVLMMRQFECDKVECEKNECEKNECEKIKNEEIENEEIECCEHVKDVPDPYYGGVSGFEEAYQMLAANAEALLDYLEREQ